MVREDDVELHPQDPAGAGLRAVVRPAGRGELLGDDQLDEEAVRGLRAVAGLAVAGVLELALGAALGDGVVEFEVDGAIVAGVVGLPAFVNVLLTEKPDLGSGCALLWWLLLVLRGGLRLSGERRVTVASGRDALGDFLELPGDLLQLPKIKSVCLLIEAHQPVELQRDLVVAGGVDGGVVVRTALDVGGREEPDAVVRHVRDRQAPLDVQRLEKLGLVWGVRGERLRRNDSLGLEFVLNGHESAGHGGREMAVQKHGEGVSVATAVDDAGVVNEGPGLQLRVLVRAVVAVLVEGSLVVNVDLEGGVEAVELDGVLLDLHRHGAAQESASALLAVSVENDGRALQLPVQAHSRALRLLLAAERQRESAVGLGHGVGKVLHLDSMVQVMVAVVVLVLSVRVVDGSASRTAHGRRGSRPVLGLLHVRDVPRGVAQESGHAAGHLG